jgi:hypothetical protein
MRPVYFFTLAQSANRQKLHLPFRAGHLGLASEGDFAICAGPVTYREFPELAQLDCVAVLVKILD